MTTATVPAWRTDVPAAPPPSRSRRVRRALLIAVAAVVGVGLLLLSVTAEPPSTSAYDPDDTGRTGTRALAQVLRQQGVRVEVVRGIEGLEAAGVDSGTTVVLGLSPYLGKGAAERAADASAGARRLVVVEPDDVELDDLGLPLETVGDAADETLTAECRSSITDPTDRLDAATTLYAAAPGPDGEDALVGAARCFPAPPGTDLDGHAVVLLAQGATGGPSTPETVVLGSSAAITNSSITRESNAALALRALGPAPRVVWYVPVVTDVDAPDATGRRVQDPDRGVPPWLTPGALLVGLVVVLYALARGRRLGRLVTEPLPVVVRAVETTEARGRLYHRAADRRVAAAALRAGTRGRLADRLGLPRTTTRVGLVDAVARSTGRPTTDVENLLDGPDPTTDPDLLLLAQALADLEESVRPA